MRTIKANKAVQILADKIGVCVTPGYFTTDLSSTYNYDYVTVASKLPDNDNYVIADNDNNAFVYNGETKTIAEETKYELVGVDDSSNKLYNDNAVPLENQTLFEAGETWTPRTTVGSLCSVAGDAVYVNSDRVRTSDSYYIVNGSWIEDITYSYKRGIITSSSTVTSTEHFTLSSTTDWENHPKFENGDHILYADSDSVAVGTNLHFTKDYPDYNKQTVTATSSSEYAIDCSMFYSVNAENWTEISGLERQNVINNIPRGEYLKFTQDVVLTD